MIKLLFVLILLSSCSSLPSKEEAKLFYKKAKITTYIQAELVRRQGLDAFLIDIKTNEDNIILSGEVNYLHQKVLANIIATKYTKNKYHIIDNIKLKN